MKNIKFDQSTKSFQSIFLHKPFIVEPNLDQSAVLEANMLACDFKRTPSLNNFK